MSPLIFWVVFSVFVLHKTFGESQLNIVEKEALLKFINNVNDHISRPLKWNPSESACLWQGVTCNPSGINVLYLSLPGRNLTGEIPPNTIGKLTSLRVLSLRFNNLSGEIPSDFSNLIYLKSLFLNKNRFSGNITSALFDLPYLTQLRLDNNSFSGQLPDKINNADYLIYFNVSYNKLVGRIPSSLSRFQESAFSNNTYLCGPPLSPCNYSYPIPVPKSDGERDNTSTSTGRRAIFGIYSGSTMLLLILLSSLGKTVYQHMIKPPSDQSSELMKGKKLVTLVDDVDGFDFDDLLKTTAEVLGEGSAGTVSYKQVLVGKNKTVVVKILKDVVVPEEEFTKTMEDLGKILYDHVVPLRAFYNYSSNEKLLVYDYMPAGSLSARLHGSVPTQLDWDHRMRIALNAAKGLAYLHEKQKIVHGNIRSSNIFLQQETNINGVSLSDCGLNTLFRGSSSLNHRVTGYWAPEVLKTWEFTFESDVYSFGVLLLELLTRKIPNTVSLDTEGVHFSDWVGSIICDELKDELFDVELTRDHKIDKMGQLLQIAKNCVLIAPNQRPPMCYVVSMMEDICCRDFKLSLGA